MHTKTHKSKPKLQIGTFSQRECCNTKRISATQITSHTHTHSYTLIHTNSTARVLQHQAHQRNLDHITHSLTPIHTHSTARRSQHTHTHTDTHTHKFHSENAATPSASAQLKSHHTLTHTHTQNFHSESAATPSASAQLRSRAVFHVCRVSRKCPVSRARNQGVISWIRLCHWRSGWYIYIYMRICTHMRIHVNVCIDACMCVCMYMWRAYIGKLWMSSITEVSGIPCPKPGRDFVNQTVSLVIRCVYMRVCACICARMYTHT
jgi:hypothetical protein